MCFVQVTEPFRVPAKDEPVHSVDSALSLGRFQCWRYFGLVDELTCNKRFPSSVSKPFTSTSDEQGVEASAGDSERSSVRAAAVVRIVTEETLHVDDGAGDAERLGFM